MNQFIDHFYYYTGFKPVHTVDRFLPDGEVQIIFDLTDYPKFIYHNETLKDIQPCKNVWFSGFRTEPITIPSGWESEMVIVQFRKGRAFPFLCEPMQELTNFVVDAKLVIRAEILNIREVLLEAETPLQKLQILEKKLLNGILIQRVETGLPSFSDPVFADDGKKVVFRGGTKKSKRDTDYHGELYCINTDGTDLKQLTIILNQIRLLRGSLIKQDLQNCIPQKNLLRITVIKKVSIAYMLLRLTAQNSGS